jgi:hypothetical protein
MYLDIYIEREREIEKESDRGREKGRERESSADGGGASAGTERTTCGSMPSAVSTIPIKSKEFSFITIAERRPAPWFWSPESSTRNYVAGTERTTCGTMPSGWPRATAASTPRNRLQTLRSRGYTLHHRPTPDTLRPAPYALHPTPYTLVVSESMRDDASTPRNRFTSSNLNFKLCNLSLLSTVNLQPSTLNPET